MRHLRHLQIYSSHVSQHKPYIYRLCSKICGFLVLHIFVEISLNNLLSSIWSPIGDLWLIEQHLHGCTPGWCQVQAVDQFLHHCVQSWPPTNVTQIYEYKLGHLQISSLSDRNTNRRKTSINTSLTTCKCPYQTRKTNQTEKNINKNKQNTILTTSRYPSCTRNTIKHKHTI